MSKVIQTSLSSALRNLRESSKSLNSLTEDATQTVRDVEGFLRDECSIGIRTSIPIGIKDNVRMFMAYRKFNSQWRITLQFGADDDDPEFRPWTDCSRDNKLWSIEHLPSLIKAIDGEVDSRIDAAEKTLSFLQTVPRQTSEE